MSKTTDFQWSLFISILVAVWSHVSDSQLEFEFNVAAFVTRAYFGFANFLTNFCSLFSKMKHAMIDVLVYSLWKDIPMQHKMAFAFIRSIVAVICFVSQCNRESITYTFDRIYESRKWANLIKWSSIMVYIIRVLLQNE